MERDRWSPRSGGRGLLALALLLPLSGTAGPPRYRSVRLDGVPHVRQQPDFCGEAAAEMALRWRGHPIDQDQVFKACAVDPALGRGAITAELRRGLEALGYATGPVWHQVEAARAGAQLEAIWARLHADLLREVPSIVCTRYDRAPQTTEHFRLVVGYDAATDEVLYHEPAERAGAYRRMARSELLELWPLRYQPETWTVIRLALDLQSPPLPAAESGISAAALARHVMDLKAHLPGPGFTVVVEPPFVVIGDESPAQVRRRARGTVHWALKLLREAYFARDPVGIYDIWLLRDAHSYRRQAAAISGQVPDTPYGYYDASARALVMNIETGGGTLVHELVHPFVEANFPDCPAWFNEGLGSLYEQSGQRDGQIRGLTNWRLEGLQEAIRAGALPALRGVLLGSDAAFYADDSGLHYAMARYLLYYLQEQGQLRDYYRRFTAAQKTDPRGLKTLKQLLGVNSLAAFQKGWERWVLTLSYPPST